MEKSMKLISLVFTTHILGISWAYAAELNISPVACSSIPGGFDGSFDQYCTNVNDSAGLIEGLYGVEDLFLAYKDNTDGNPNDEEGPFAGSYTTTYITDTATSNGGSNDKSGATISYVGDPAPSILCPDCYLAVKDGNQSPSTYIYDISEWDGISDINLSGFWPGSGSISHVAIYSNAVPIPAAVWFFGSALVGLATLGRRKKLSQAS